MKEFEDKSHLFIARLLNDKVDDVVWVRVLCPTLEPKKVYKNAQVRKTMKKFKEYNKMTLTLKQNIEMNLNLRSM